MLSRNVNNSKQKQPPSVLYYTDCPGLLQPRINNNLTDADINNNRLLVIVLHYKPLVSYWNINMDKWSWNIEGWSDYNNNDGGESPERALTKRPRYKNVTGTQGGFIHATHSNADKLIFINFGPRRFV